MAHSVLIFSSVTIKAVTSVITVYIQTIFDNIVGHCRPIILYFHLFTPIQTNWILRPVSLEFHVPFTTEDFICYGREYGFITRS